MMLIPVGHIGLGGARSRSVPLPLNVVLPSLTGTANVAETLTVDFGEWLRADTLTAQAWYVDPLADGSELLTTDQGEVIVLAGKTYIPGNITSYKIPLAREAQYIGIDVVATNEYGSRTVESYAVGPVGKPNLLANFDFALAGPPPSIVGTGWAISGGKAIGSSSASAAQLVWPSVLIAGATYQFGFNLLARSAGAVTPRLVGGSGAVSGTAFTTVGVQSNTLVCVDQVDVDLNKSAGFVGEIDNVFLYRTE